MKFTVIFPLAVIFCVQQSLSMRGYLKPIKWNIQQIGTRCRGLVYKLIPVTRYETIFYGVCDKLVRPIDKGFMNVRVSAKTATMQNYRHLMSLNRIEPCKIMDDPKKFSVLNFLFDNAKELFPQYVHPCPYTEIKIYNVSFGFMQNPSNKLLADFAKMNFHFPNGVYKIDIDGWDEETGDGANSTVWIEAKYKKRLTQDLSDL